MIRINEHFFALWEIHVTWIHYKNEVLAFPRNISVNVWQNIQNSLYFCLFLFQIQKRQTKFPIYEYSISFKNTHNKSLRTLNCVNLV